MSREAAGRLLTSGLKAEADGGEELVVCLFRATCPCIGSEPRGRMHGLRDVCPRKGALIIGLKQAVCPSRTLPVHELPIHGTDEAAALETWSIFRPFGGKSLAVPFGAVHAALLGYPSTLPCRAVRPARAGLRVPGLNAVSQ
jgi:hypothetical protein